LRLERKNWLMRRRGKLGAAQRAMLSTQPSLWASHGSRRAKSPQTLGGGSWCCRRYARGDFGNWSGYGGGRSSHLPAQTGASGHQPTALGDDGCAAASPKAERVACPKKRTYSQCKRRQRVFWLADGDFATPSADGFDSDKPVAPLQLVFYARSAPSPRPRATAAAPPHRQRPKSSHAPASPAGRRSGLIEDHQAASPRPWATTASPPLATGRTHSPFKNKCRYYCRGLRH
jgi:hypothetical protein